MKSDICKEMQDKAELLFDNLKGVLDDAEFFKWQETEVTTLLSLISGYHHHHRRLFGSEEENTSGVKEESQSKTLVAMDAIDRSLTKLRRFLLQRLPYESLSEPNVPSSAPCNGDTATRTNSHAHSLVSTKDTVVAPPVYPVDAFLYLEEDIEELVQRGCIAREYCRACGTTDIGLTDFITHSFSQDQLLYLCVSLLPALCDPSYALQDHSLRRLDTTKEAIGEPPFLCKHIVDVGSRLGVLPLTCSFAAEEGLLSKMERVTGIEIDESFVTLQRETTRRFVSHKASSLKMDIMHGDCLAEAGACVLRVADVIILHNVFEYFVASPKDHLQAWKQIRELVSRPGQLLICSPDIESTFASFTDADVLEVLGLKSDEPEESNESRKRSRESNASDSPHVPNALHSWLNEWLEEVRVSEVRESFMRLRGCSGHAHRSGGDGCGDECVSECSETEELRERLESIIVYAVR